jgi:hypothetical protein
MRRLISGWSAFGALAFIGLASLDAQDATPRFVPPASPAEAAKQLDLAALPLLEGAEAPTVRQCTSLAYQVKTGLKSAYGQIKSQLTERGWKEGPDALVSEDYASGVFSKNGFVTSLTIMPSTPPGPAVIRLQQHGNVDLASLPTGPDSKLLYGGPLSVISTTPSPPEKAAEWIRDTLTKAGWEPYGGGSPVQEYRNSGVILTTMVSEALAPAKGSTIQYSARMIAQEIPAPPDAAGIQFADDINQLMFDAKSDADSIADFYRDRLAGQAWKATTDHWIEDTFSRSLIFRNQAGDLLLMEHKDIDGKSRVVVRYQSAADVEAEEERFQAAKAKAMKDKGAPKSVPRVRIATPKGAEGDAKPGASVEWTVPKGSALKAAKAIRTALEADGWKESSGALDPLAGLLLLEKNDASITIDYTDTGFLPAEFTIRASGCELEFR